MNAMLPESLATRERYREQFVQLAPVLAGARLPWLGRARARAFERYALLGLPSPRDEEWKYTSVAALERHAYALATEASAGVDEAWLASLAIPGHQQLVFVNGRHQPALSTLGALPQGVVVGSLGEALAARPERFEVWLDAAADHGNGFAALNAALWADGAHVEVAAGCRLAAPLQILHLSTAADLAACPRSLIRLGAGAGAEIVEQHAGPDATPYFTNACTEIVLERGAALVHDTLQLAGARAHHIADIRVTQAADSRYLSRAFAFGALLSRTELAIRLDGEGCEATLLGLYLADRRQHVDHHTRIDHARPRGTSRQLYKGVLDGAGRAVFNGKVIVHADAQHSDARQANHNLLLSARAEVDTKPQLEIYADDVKCSHGATVGELDAAQTFYLRSRGMDAVAARALLTFAFANEVLAQVDRTELRIRLQQLLKRRLPDAAEESS